MAGHFDQEKGWTMEISFRCPQNSSNLPAREVTSLWKGSLGDMKDPPTERLVEDVKLVEDKPHADLHAVELNMGQRLREEEDDRTVEAERTGCEPEEGRRESDAACSVAIILPENNAHPQLGDQPMVQIITEHSDALQDEPEPPMVEIINDPLGPQQDRPFVEIIDRTKTTRRRRATESSQPFQPLLRLDTSVVPVSGPFSSPTYESPSQRRRRERRTSGMPQVMVPESNIVAGSTISIDVVGSPVAQTPRGRRSRRRISPDRRRDGEIDILDESDDDNDETIDDFRGRQKKRPSELKCFRSSAFGPKRAYPAQTPVEPGVADGVDFRRLPNGAINKRVSDWVGANARVVEFVSTPISPVPEVWSP